MSPHSYILFTLFNAESGRTDVINTINDFVFTPASKSAFENFTIVNDDVLEFDELLIAEFNFGPKISNKWNAKKGEPSIAFILITDDDCELCSDRSKHQKINSNNIYSTLYFQASTVPPLSPFATSCISSLQHHNYNKIMYVTNILKIEFCLVIC